MTFIIICCSITSHISAIPKVRTKIKHYKTDLWIGETCFSEINIHNDRELYLMENRQQQNADSFIDTGLLSKKS